MTDQPDQPLYKVLKIGNCKTLSGKGDLAYHIGYDKTSEIFFRMVSNSGGGWFSADWISLKEIISAIGKANKPLTSYALQSLFKGKSVNTPAFLFAALKQEGFVEADPDNPRCYRLKDAHDSLNQMKVLITKGTDLKIKIITASPIDPKSKA